MKWVSMAEWLYTSPWSLCTMPRVGWSVVKQPSLGLRCSENMFAGVINHYCRAVWWTNLGFVDAKRISTRMQSAKSKVCWSNGNANDIAHKYFCDNCMNTALWQLFGEDHFVFQHHNVQSKVNKNKVWQGYCRGIQRALTSTSNTSNKQGQLNLNVQQAYIGENTRCQWCQYTAVHILLTGNAYRHAGLGYRGCFPVNNLC